MKRIYREHAIGIADEAGSRILIKYKKGQEEHGGDLRETSLTELLENALDEVTDLFVYLLTLRDKLENNKFEDNEFEDSLPEDDFGVVSSRYDNYDYYPQDDDDDEFDPWSDY